MFPDVSFQDVDYAELQAALTETAQEMGLIVSDVQVMLGIITRKEEIS